MAIAARPGAGDRDFVQSGESGFHRPEGLLQAFGKGPSDRHHFADRFHRCVEGRVCARELLEGEARHLGDDIVDGGFEARRGHAGDLVVELVQCVANGKLGRDFGNREPGGFGGQCGGTADPGVHLDHDHAAVFRVDGELNIRPAGLDPDLAQTRDRGVAHDLVFLVRQGQCWCHGDGITGVHAHRVNVFDRADDDAVVGFVADNLHLVFLPAEDGFFDQHLAHWGGLDAAVDDVEELFPVIGNSCAQPAQRKGRANNGGQAHGLECFLGICPVVHRHGAG